MKTQGEEATKRFLRHVEFELFEATMRVENNGTGEI
jgi:hypothetical protein